MPYIKSIDLGTIFNVYETLCDGLDEGDKVYGCYRSLQEMVVKLAEFYLSGSRLTGLVHLIHLLFLLQVMVHHSERMIVHVHG